ncbi:gliding motility-associated lipoprotein GldH [Algoriphagus boseongensis]|uniref:Gliding motility-associated lipoprotein GldH n=1 Tax=Algoriphagus boseongensis TaxID=1442587 RepID=A0A4R6T9C1_9BACT|nr:gliding motility lipoprotein GldH [Algoriphagus boseongensis]TDQ18452.1 gliding motility-associated lipoprotein GldH [Algoriphagus boseongensis]
MKTRNKLVIWGLLLSFGALVSCDGNRAFEEFHAFPGETWTLTDTVKFELNKEPNELGETLIGVRFNENYPFSNLYVNFWVNDSSGNVLETKLLNIPLFDSKSGKPIGKGFGDTFTKFDTLRFPLNEKGRSITILQYMRKEEVEGIEAIGIKILKK